MLEEAAQDAQVHRPAMRRDSIVVVGRGPAGVAELKPGAAGFANDVQKLAAKADKNKNALVALSGQVSSRLREELEKRGFMVRDRLVPGPLK